MIVHSVTFYTNSQFFSDRWSSALWCTCPPTTSRGTVVGSKQNSSTVSAQVTAGTADKAWDTREMAPSAEGKWLDAQRPSVCLCPPSRNISDIPRGHSAEGRKQEGVTRLVLFMYDRKKEVDLGLNEWLFVFCTKKDERILF